MNLHKTLVSAVLITVFCNVACYGIAADLFVVTEGYVGGDGAVVRISPTGGIRGVANKLFLPRGIAADSQGNLFVGMGASQFDVLMLKTNGTQSSIPGAGYYYSLEMAANDVLYAGASTHIDRRSPNGAFETFGTGSRNSGGMAFDAGGNLYATDTINLINKFDPSGARTVFSSSVNSPIDIAIDSHGDLFVTAYYDGAIYKFTPGGVRSTFATGLSGPWGLAVDPSDNLYVSEREGGVITKFSPSGAKSLYASGLVTPNYLIFAERPAEIPEPSTLLLAVIGLPMLMRRRR